MDSDILDFFLKTRNLKDKKKKFFGTKEFQTEFQEFAGYIQNHSLEILSSPIPDNADKYDWYQFVIQMIEPQSDHE
jgi:hypothetical protein